MTKKWRAIACAAILTSFSLWGVCLGQNPAASEPRGGQPAMPDKSADEATIRANAEAFAQAFGRADAKALAEFWTETGEYVDEEGGVHVGRKAIEEGYTQFFAHNPHAQLRLVIDSLRILGDTAIEDGRAVADPHPIGVPGTGQYSAVHVKVGGKWMLASVRDIHVPTPSAYSGLVDFEWLIGSWVAEENGVKTESTCQWVSNKSFVQRSYTTTHPDGSKTTGVQMIGWNPRGGHVQSWNFSADGGHATGVWTPIENGWSAEIQGTLGDGTPVTAVNRFARLDDNAYVWQSVQRTVGGQPVSDTDEVVIRRAEPHQ